MDDFTKSVCRVCLSISDVNQYADLSSDDELSEIMRGLFPGMNWDLVSTPKVCLPCVKKVKFAYIFKETIMHNEVKIKSDPSIKSALNICRLCLNQQQTDIGVMCLYENTTYSYQLIRTITEIATSQLDFDIFPKPVMCAHCWSVIKEIYSFKKSCFKTEEKLQKLSVDSSVTVLSNEEIVAMITKKHMNSPNTSVKRSNVTVKNKTIRVKLEMEELNTCLESDDCIIDSLCKLTSHNLIETKPDISTIDTHSFSVGDSDKDARFSEPQASVEDVGHERSNRESKLVSEDSDNTFKENVSNRNTIITNPEVVKKEIIDNTVLNKAKRNKISVKEQGISRIEKTIGGRGSKNRKKLSGISNKSSSVPNLENSWYKLIDKTYYCASCKYRAPAKYRITRHYKALHADPATIVFLQCNFCPYKTTRKDKLKDHITRHSASKGKDLLSGTVKKRAPDTSKKTSVKSNLDNSCYKFTEKATSTSTKSGRKLLRIKAEREIESGATTELQPNLKTYSYTCFTCGFGTENKELLTRHIKAKHDKRIECDECEFVTSAQIYLAMHMKLHKWYNRLGNKCQKCQFSCKNPNVLDKHIKRCGGGVSTAKQIKKEGAILSENIKKKLSGISNKSSSVPNLENSWYKLIDKTYYCASCKYRAPAKYRIMRHYKALHADPATIVFLQCNFCPYKTTRKDRLKDHITRHSASKGKDLLSGTVKKRAPDTSKKTSVKSNLDNSCYKFTEKATSTSTKSGRKLLRIKAEREIESGATTELQPNLKTYSYTCFTCGFGTENKELLTRHNKAKHDKRIECDECEFVTSAQIYLAMHMKLHKWYNRLGNKCQKCQFSCKNPNVLDKHIKRCGGGVSTAKQIKKEGAILSENIKKKISKYNIPNNAGTNQIYNSDCLNAKISSNRRKSNRDNLSNNGNTHYYPNTRKDQTSTNIDSEKSSQIFKGLLDNVDNSSSKVCQSITEKPNKEEYLLCSCGKEFKYPNEEVRVLEKSFVCKICKKNFKSLSTFNRHKQFHSVDNEFVCYVCKRVFRVRRNLTSHLLTHSSDRNAVCHLCGKRFISNGRLDLHLLTHGVDRKYGCSICEMKFRTPSNLRGHIQLHFAEKTFQCNLCDKAFKTRRYLDSHMLKHSIIKLYKCQICRKDFKFPYGLTNHMKSHSVEKKFECYICQDRYQTQAQLNRHLTSHNCENLFEYDDCKKSFKTDTSLASHKKIHSGEMFYCYHCKYKAKRKDYLATHMIQHMPKNAVPKFKCSHCKHSSTRADNLAEHIKRVHKNEIAS